MEALSHSWKYINYSLFLTLWMDGWMDGWMGGWMNDWYPYGALDLKFTWIRIDFR